MLYTNAYKILEIDKSVSDSKVKSAYRDLAKKHHPDKVQHLGKAYVKAAQEKFQKIQNTINKLIFISRYLLFIKFSYFLYYTAWYHINDK